MKWKFWERIQSIKKDSSGNLVPTAFNLNRNENLQASIQTGCSEGNIQYINITAVDNQRALELYKQVRDELRKK